MKILNTQNHVSNQVKAVGNPTDPQDAEVLSFRKQNGGYFWSTSLTSISPNTVIPINTANRVYGTGVAAASETALTIQPGTYQVTYEFHGDANGGGEVGAAELRLNGSQIPGTKSYSISGGGVNETSVIVNTSTIVVTAANSSLQLFSVGPVAMPRNGVPSGSITAAININQVA